MKQVKARVISTTELMPDTCLVWLQAPEIARSASPGQFVMVLCGDTRDPLLRRPLSVHRTDGQEGIALLFSVVGRGTSLLSQYREGDLVDLLGPLGKGYSVQADSRRLLLVAGGMGIAPLIFLADENLKRGRGVNMLIGAASAPWVYPESLLPSSLDLVIVTEDGSEGTKGVVTDLVCDRLDQADEVFACGPVSMYKSVLDCSGIGGRPVQVSLEVVMGCGVGACYGCTVRTRQGLRQVCRDGPVFDLNEVLFEEGGDIRW